MPLCNKKQIDFVAAIAKLNLGPFGEQGARYAFKQVDFNGNGKQKNSYSFRFMLEATFCCIQRDIF